MKYTLSKTVFEKLLKQLVDMEEKGTKSDSAGIMGPYIQKLSKLMEAAVQIESDDTSVPFVVIGSDVKVRDLDLNESSIYHITTPEVFKAGENDVNLLSPIGKALLLKDAGEAVDIRIPSGMMHLRIESINLNSEIDVGNLFAYIND